MKNTKLLSFVLLALMLTGCYNAVVMTDKTPSNQTIDKPWAMSFIYGLVPPAPIDASTTCTDGVAKVETKISFLNGLVSALTFSIVTPMHITVTCAADGMSAIELEEDQKITIPENATDTDLRQIYQYASDLAVKLDKPVYVAH